MKYAWHKKTFNIVNILVSGIFHGHFAQRLAVNKPCLQIVRCLLWKQTTTHSIRNNNPIFDREEPLVKQIRPTVYWTNREASLRSLCRPSWICHPRENKPACRRAFHQEGSYHDGYALFAHRTCPTKRRHCFKRVKREDLDCKIWFYDLWEEYSCLDSFQTFANCNEKFFAPNFNPYCNFSCDMSCL